MALPVVNEEPLEEATGAFGLEKLAAIQQLNVDPVSPLSSSTPLQCGVAASPKTCFATAVRVVCCLKCCVASNQLYSKPAPEHQQGTLVIRCSTVYICLAVALEDTMGHAGCVVLLLQANARFMLLVDDLLRPESLPRGWSAEFNVAQKKW